MDLVFMCCKCLWRHICYPWTQISTNQICWMVARLTYRLHTSFPSSAELQEGKTAAVTGVSLMKSEVKNEVVVRRKEIPQTWHEVPLIQEDVFLSVNHRRKRALSDLFRKVLDFANSHTCGFWRHTWEFCSFSAHSSLLFLIEKPHNKRLSGWVLSMYGVFTRSCEVELVR